MRTIHSKQIGEHARWFHGVLRLVLAGVVPMLGLLLVGCQPAAKTPVAGATPPSATSQNGGDFEKLIPAAQSFIDQLQRGDFTAAEKAFDATMLRAMPAAKLKDTWQQLLAQVGAYQGQLTNRTETAQGYRIVYVATQFEKAVLDVQVVFNAQGQISGLFFKPTQATPVAYTAPAYVSPNAFIESSVTVGSGEWALPGTLTLPNGSGPFPAVVLVHGSGPNDRDETIGPNKPFRDLAWGLASQGVAVLRYDKRTLTHAAQFTQQILAKLTLQEETIDDALLAVRLLRSTAKIDPQRIYVLGHSLGAMAAPRIAQQDPALAGLILLAAPSIPLEDEILDQYTYLFQLDGVVSEAEKAQLEKLQAQVARVKDPKLSGDTPASDLPLGIQAAYWVDLRGYQPAEVARGLAMPLLVLQGGRDYQVSPAKDFAGWKAALAQKSNTTLTLYPSLNHLMIAGQGMSTPEEYQKAGHVSEEVVADIAAWVKQ